MKYLSFKLKKIKKFEKILFLMIKLTLESPRNRNGQKMLLVLIAIFQKFLAKTLHSYAQTCREEGLLHNTRAYKRSVLLICIDSHRSRKLDCGHTKTVLEAQKNITYKITIGCKQI